MRTKKLELAYKKVESLVKFLEKREWENSGKLLLILDQADEEIRRISEEAILSVVSILETSYAAEAHLWAENKMTNLSGEKINLTKSQQAKAKTEMKRINKAINALQEINNSNG